MIIPSGVDIQMPPPFGGTPPTITRSARGEAAEDGELIKVHLVGDIGPLTQYLELIKVLDTATEKDSIRIMIDSPGGDVYTTQHLVGRMESCKAKVTTVASGLVASAATFLWFYGKEKEVDRWARFMFHSSLHGDWGKSLMIQETATELVNYMKNLLTDMLKAGVITGAEYDRVFKGKSDVELSGATVRSRLGLSKVKAEGEVVPEEQPAEGEPAPAEAPVETPVEQPAEPAPETPAAPAEGEPAPAEAPAEGEGEEAPAVLDIEKIFAENGVEMPEPVVTPENQPTEGGEETTSEPAPEPETPEVAPEAKKGGKKVQKKQKLYRRVVKADGTEMFEEVPEETPAEPAAPAEGEPAPAEAPAARCGGKKTKKPGKKVRAEGEMIEPNEGDISTAEDAEPEQNEEPIVPGAGEGEPAEAPGTTEEEQAPLIDKMFDRIFAENEVEMPAEEPAVAPVEPAPVETPEQTEEENGEAEQPAEGEPAETPAEGAPAEGEEEPAITAKCGGKKKAVKRRKADGDPAKVDPGTKEIATPKEADENSNVEVVKKGPEAYSRYW